MKPKDRSLLFTRTVLLMMTPRHLLTLTSAFQSHTLPHMASLPLYRPPQQTIAMTFLSSPPSSLLISGSSSENYSFLSASDLPPEDVLSYLPFQDMPPQTKSLLEKISNKYIYGRSARNVFLKEILDVIKEEYQSFDVPVQVGSIKFDVSSTGEEVDESVAEILSFAALLKLPKEITLELLSVSNSTSLSTCRQAFAVTGWDKVFFPRGLAIVPKRPYREMFPAVKMRRSFRSKSSLNQEAAQVVAAAGKTKSPLRKLESKEEFMKQMAEQFAEPTKKPKLLSWDMPSYFPENVPLQGISWKRLKRIMDKQYANLKRKGRAGFVSYAFFNFVLYTVGMVLQWRRIAPADPFANTSIVTICLRKFGRVFASMYVLSNILKIPKLFISIGLAPMAEKILRYTKEKLHVSETLASVIVIGAMVVAWAGLVSIPVITEYSRLHRLVQLEKVVQGVVVQPA